MSADEGDDARIPEGSTWSSAELSGSIVSRFRTIADLNRHREAVSSPAGTWSYGELEGAVTRLAGGLQQRLGRAPARPVAVLAAHDGPLVVAVLGVICSGHIVVVLDPAAPAAERQAIVDSCGPGALLHDAHHASLAAELGVPLTAPIDALGGDFVEPALEPSSPAMLAFTSGTSTEPKGALITHGVLLNVVRGASLALRIDEHDRMPMLFPVSLAVAAYPMFIPLLNGGALATLDVRSEGLAPVGSFLERERISVAYMAPTVVRFLEGALEGRTFPDLRLLALGGEVVDAEVVQLSTELFSPRQLANGYGTTETGVVALQVFEPDATIDGAVPSGAAVPGTEIVILDEHGSRCEAGVPGEIVVTSPYLFTGYWRHEELGRQVLGDDPEGRPGWRAFRTGDVGSVDAAGTLTVHGRVDTKVKVRGRFVVIGEVESSLRALDGVADAAVLAERRGGNVELVAFFVPAGAHEASPTALRAELLRDHQAFFVPSRWVALDEMPRLPNGKLDRRALVATDVGDDLAGASMSGPAPALRELREEIGSLWTSMLPVGTVGDDEDFFELGGDSLLAAQMLIELEHRVGVIVPMADLLHARTVRSLARVIDQEGSRTAPRIVAEVQVGTGTRPRLWFVPDLQGSAFRVRHLARALGRDQSVWSFESPLLAGEPPLDRDLSAFAARLVAAMREVQDDGPYWLAGYSFGGICAYEMARQLRADGHEIAFLGVVDVGPAYRGPGRGSNRGPNRPWFGVARPPASGSSWSESLRHYYDMLAASPRGAARHLMVRSGVAEMVDPLRFRIDIRRHGRVRPEWRLWYAWDQHWRLAAHHWNRSSTYEGRLDLFWEATTGSDDSTMGWGQLVGDLHIHRFAVADGDHDAILEPPGAGPLGVALRSVLDEIGAQRTGHP